MSNEGEPRKLTDLRVVDLRAELEKRGLEKTGVKVQLIKKLQEALKEEGKDPDTYEFSDRPKRLSSNTNVDNESDMSEETADKPGTEEKTMTDKEEELETKDKISTDVDDSINLTLEEDEDQLIDEAESNPTEVPKEDVSDRISSSEKPVEETEPDREKLDEEQPVEQRVEETERADQESEPAVTEKAVKEKVDDEREGEAEEEKTVADNEKLGEKKEEKSVDDSTEDSGRDKTAGSAETASAASDSGIAADGKKMNESDSTVNENAVKQEKEDNTSSTAGRSLWLSGLATRTRATDLKQLLSKYGKVVGAKVVTNARSPSARCYGYVVMATIADADNCIKHCHRTELHGRFISVDKARSEKHDVINSKQAPKDRDIKRINEKEKEKENDEKKSKSDTEKSKDDDSPRQRAKTDSDNKSDKSKSDDKIKKDDPKDAAKKRERRKTPEKDIPKKRVSRERSPHRSEGSTKASRDRSKGTDRDRSHEKPKNRLSNERDKDRKNDVLSFRHIRDERDRQRERERERAMREAEQRRRREEQARQREIERKHREEAARLDKEREQLRIERERLQREKAELLRLERKRIEQEKLELQRQQRKLEESRRAPKRPSEDVRDPYPDNRKRPPPLVQSAGRYDTSMLSSPVMYDVSSRNNGPPESLSKKHDPYKRDEYKDFKSRELETRDRNDVRRDTYKPREDYSKLRDEYNKPREDVRKNREEVRPRETYSKHDRSDFAPPPPQISGPGMSVKYSAPDPTFSGLTRNVHEVMRRGEPLPAVTLTVRGYPERGSGPADHRGSPPNSSYRSSRDERDSRRPEPEHRSGKDMVSSRDHRYVEMSSLKERENGWHQSSLKTFGSISGPNNSGVAIRDPWLKNEGPISNNSNAWVPSGRSMDTSGSRYDRCRMERR